MLTYRPRVEKVVEVNINGQLLEMEAGAVTILPNSEKNNLVQIGSNLPLSVAGGDLGLVIDLRKAGEKSA